MRVALMQPYLFPYIGYFQLMQAVDLFVFYDDVQYMKGGWINRNVVRMGDVARWLTLPVKKAPVNFPINKRQYLPHGALADAPACNLLEACYVKAPHFGQVSLMAHELLGLDDHNVARFNANSLIHVAKHIGIDCEFARSSDLAQTPGLKGQQRVIDICKQVGASQYINPIGGMSLYNATDFKANDLSLAFLRTTSPATELRDGPVQLSIIDWLMHLGEEGCAAHLDEYAILGAQ